MQRLNLSRAKWMFRDCSDQNWFAAKVPGCVHQDLRRNREIPDPFWGTNELDLQWIEDRDWEYRTEFKVSSKLRAEAVIELSAEGLDTLAKITLNGEEVGRTENMFTPYRWNVKQLLREGTNELTIRFAATGTYLRTQHAGHTFKEFNDPVGHSNRIRKEQCQFGWDWGPRFVTAGIWQPIGLEAWSANRLQSVRIEQSHAVNGEVTVTLAPELEREDGAMNCRWVLSHQGQTLERGEGVSIKVRKAKLWWPAGHGDQPLYDLEVEVIDGPGALIGTWSERIGLRTIELDLSEDKRGEKFQFVVNGRAIFAKGANWIPAHSFVAGSKRADYERDLRSAVEANMNMVRVWGGGIYETEEFYDVCDELGLLVWQDFAFACTLYPVNEAFAELVRPEADAQVRRLRHRASLALWCGNNEIWSLNPRITDDGAAADLLAGYKKIFHEVLPEAVAAGDPSTAYWPSSPWRREGAIGHEAGEKTGDTHFWDVWHSRHPVRDYEKWDFRFVAEFGMQSYSSPATNATFWDAKDNNVFGPVMENHQKNAAGNQIILDYVSRLYRFPKSQDDLIYLSQLNQAHCMQVGVEHYRRISPHCMGALYWQLNDTWPVASWSSLEFTGRWKALHYAAKRFFAPALVSAHLIGEESITIGNYRRSTIDQVDLYTVFDAPKATRGTLVWDVMHVDGRRLSGGRKVVQLRWEDGGVKQHSLKLSKELNTYIRDAIYVRVRLRIGAKIASEETVFLTAPRFVDLPKSKVRTQVKLCGTDEAEITFTAANLQHRFGFELGRMDFRASENFFELYPKESKTVRVKLAKSTTVAQLRKRLSWRSLVDTY